MSADSPRSFAADFRRHFIAGLFVLIPIAFTVWVLHAIFSWFSDLGQPIVNSLIASISATPGKVVDPEYVKRVQKTLELFKDILSFIVVVLLIYLLGWGTTKVIGRRVLMFFDAVMHRIPLAKGIYGTVKQLLSTFQSKPEGVQRVVLVSFPNSRMKSVGLVMRTFRDADSNREVAAVYIPIAPFLTSGNLEMIDLDDLVSTSWSVDEAMKFIASGGSAGPDVIEFDRSPVRRSMDPQ